MLISWKSVFVLFSFVFFQFRFREYCVILGINWGYSLLLIWILWKIWEVTTTQPNVFVANISFLQNVIACNHKVFMKKTVVYSFIKKIWSFGCMFWNTSLQCVACTFICCYMCVTCLLFFSSKRFSLLDCTVPSEELDHGKCLTQLSIMSILGELLCPYYPVNSIWLISVAK